MCSHSVLMGANIRLRTLHDLQRHGFHLGIQCLGCDHNVIYAIMGVAEWFQAKRLNPDMEVAGSYFRCDKCGRKGAKLTPVAPYRAPDLPKLEPSRYTLKEMARRARG